MRNRTLPPLPCWYTKVAIIGRGRCGPVYLCYDRNAKVFVACKLSDCLQTFQAEMKAATLFHHPSLLRVHVPEEIDLSASPASKQWIISQYVSCGSLSDWIPLQCDRTRFFIFLYGISFALAKLHSLGFFHSDVKPSNILIDGSFEPILADFGYMKRISESTNCCSGTPNYAAPEIINGDPHNESADVYSFGMTMYEMIAGVRPFKGKGSEAIRNELLAGRFPALPEDSPFTSLYQSCISPNWQDRPTMSSVMEEIEHLAEADSEVNQEVFNSYRKRISEANTARIHDEVFGDLLNAAKLQVPKAMWICGKCLLCGIGTEIDDDKGISLLDEAAKKRYEPARKRLRKYVQAVHDTGERDRAAALAQRLDLGRH